MQSLITARPPEALPRHPGHTGGNHLKDDTMKKRKRWNFDQFGGHSSPRPDFPFARASAPDEEWSIFVPRYFGRVSPASQRAAEEFARAATMDTAMISATPEYLAEYRRKWFDGVDCPDCIVDAVATVDNVVRQFCSAYRPDDDGEDAVVFSLYTLTRNSEGYGTLIVDHYRDWVEAPYVPDDKGDDFPHIPEGGTVKQVRILLIHVTSDMVFQTACQVATSPFASNTR